MARQQRRGWWLSGRLEAATEAAIARLDEIDGDLDAPPVADAEDRGTVKVTESRPLSPGVTDDADTAATTN